MSKQGTSDSNYGSNGSQNYNGQKDQFGDPNYPPPPSSYSRHRRHRHRKCQTERYEHPVTMIKASDNSGSWVVYSQILETRNVGGKCDRNQYDYLGLKKKAGWLWNSKINSLTQYGLEEPKFMTRKITESNGLMGPFYASMSKCYIPPTVGLDRAFPLRLASDLATVQADDVRWSNVAKAVMPMLSLDTAYFQVIGRYKNPITRKMDFLRNHGSNQPSWE